MTAHNSIKIVDEIYKLSKKTHIKGLDEYIRSIFTELLKEQTVDEALAMFSHIKFPCPDNDRYKITTPKFESLIRNLKEEKHSSSYLLITSIKLINKLVQLGGDYLTQLKLHDKESTVRKVNNALQNLWEMDEGTFKKILHSWVVHCHYYFAEDELRKEANFIVNKQKELFSEMLSMDTRNKSSVLKVTHLFKKNCSEKLSFNRLPGEFIDSIELVFVEGGLKISSDNYKEQFFYSQMNKLVDRYNITAKDILYLRDIKEKTFYSYETLEDVKGEGRIPNFILGCHQLKKQKTFLDEWAANSSLFEDEEVNSAKKAKCLLSKYMSQIDIYDTGFDLKNNEFPLFPAVVKSILSPKKVNLTSTYRFKYTDKLNAIGELHKLNVLRYKKRGKEKRLHILSETPRKNVKDPKYWFEHSLDEYLGKVKKVLVKKESDLNVVNFIDKVMKYSGEGYQGYWFMLLKSLRDRSLAGSPPQYLTLMDKVLQKHFDSQFDDWVDSNREYNAAINDNQLPKENNPFVIKPEQNNKWDNEKVSAC